MSAHAGNSTAYQLMMAARKIIHDKMDGYELDPTAPVATYREQPDGFAIDFTDKQGRVWTAEFFAAGVGRGR
jgi:hypothetical protein